MVNVCCVPTCKTRSGRPGTSLHGFNKDPKLQRTWILNILRGTHKSMRNPSPFKITKNTRICSLHFEKKYIKINSEKNKLTDNAVPTIFIKDKDRARIRNGTIPLILSIPEIATSPENLVPCTSTELVTSGKPKTDPLQGIGSEERKDSLQCEILPLDTGNIVNSVLQEHDTPTQANSSYPLEPDYRRMYFDLLLEHSKCKKVVTDACSQTVPESAAGENDVVSPPLLRLKEPPL